MSKEEMEKILGRKILNFEYEFIINYLKAKKENKKLDVHFGRQNGRTKLLTEAFMIDGITSKRIIFDEFHD